MKCKAMMKKKILKFFADHAVAVTIVGSLLLILLGVGLLIRPAFVVEVFRYLFAAVNILLGGWLLISTIARVGKK